MALSTGWQTDVLLRASKKVRHVRLLTAVALRAAEQPKNTTLQNLIYIRNSGLASLAGAALAPAADVHPANRLCSNVRAKAQKAKI